MKDLNTRIQQLTKLILTTIQQTILTLRSNSTPKQPNHLLSKPRWTRTPPPSFDASESEKTGLIQQQAKTSRELEYRRLRGLVDREFKEPLGRSGRTLRGVGRGIGRVWRGNEGVSFLPMRMTLEEERRGLAAFVTKSDSLGLGLCCLLPLPLPHLLASKLKPPCQHRAGRLPHLRAACTD
ncbi:hypothetical protein Hypma_004125 [Hypsizygus marmoreus]|uniref:Uncharacterized protein n=1 Tax=Hypsizygus marmoreus TaxID=39966 RepID=A0A369J785_HYPMA|nr:hypothetical protein Hypma_004125 [Hypsizygus marmoreus]